MSQRNWLSWRLTASRLWGDSFRVAALCRNLASAYKHGRKVQLRRWSYLHRQALLAWGWDCYGRRVGNRIQLCFAPVTEAELQDPATYQNLLGLAGVCMVEQD